MTLATQYAQALYQLMQQHPQQREQYLKRMHSVLHTHGHERLFPRIYAEYQKLLLRETRYEKQRQYTPEQEQTRILLELYRTLLRA